MGKKEHHLDTHPSQEDFFYLVCLLFGVCSGLFLIFDFVFFLFCFGLFNFCWDFFECVGDIPVALFIIIIFSSGLSYKDSLVLL